MLFEEDYQKKKKYHAYAKKLGIIFLAVTQLPVPADRCKADSF